MGYDLHITRKVNWFDASPSITLDDWLEYVANDPEIQHRGFAETPTADGLERIFTRQKSGKRRMSLVERRQHRCQKS
ncbi:hypothetical protein [Rhizobium leguminosarum]|uniref:hypothetical protein n=1 Tax=Rhizobium leguminosarum TaxID=384 RepID=UPI0021BC3116|nr:hypothetical protein [Rhizobium leguminosarum]